MNSSLKKLFRQDYKSFINNYEVHFVDFYISSDNEYRDIEACEKFFLLTLYQFISSRGYALGRYQDIKGDDLDWPKFWDYLEELDRKSAFISLKLRRIGHIIQDDSKNGVRAVKANIEDKQTKSLTFEGKPLNMNERWTIADKLFNIDNIIRKLNITKDEKNQLISFVFGCHIDTSKDVLNGTYKGSMTRKEEIQEYLDKITKI